MAFMARYIGKDTSSQRKVLMIDLFEQAVFLVDGTLVTQLKLMPHRHAIPDFEQETEFHHVIAHATKLAAASGSGFSCLPRNQIVQRLLSDADFLEAYVDVTLRGRPKWPWP